MEDHEYEEQWQKLKQLADFYKVKHADWSTDVPKNWDFSQKAYEGTICYQHRGQGKVYKLENPTYADIWKAVDKGIKATGDLDHRYIEDLELNGHILRVFLGS